MRQTLQLPHLRLSYLEWNRGQEPVLLLHGLGDHALVWQSLGDRLVKDFHVVAVDLRGHGDSEKPATGYTFAEAIADLEALLDALAWPAAHILGHSWTGKLVPIWARQHPQRFRSAVLVDPFFIGKLPAWFKVTFPLLYRTLPFLQGMGPFESYEEAELKAHRLKQYRGWSPLQAAVFRAGIERKADGRWGSKFTVQARDRVFEEVLRVEGLTEPIDVPTLFVQPERGLNRTAWQLGPYQQYLTNLTVRRVPGNHWPFLVEPEAFNQAVADFWTAQIDSAVSH
jgi:pimeloyl-ACP methyl ester carboxylesterase